MSKNLNLVRWIPAILWAFVIFIQSANSAPPGADLAPDYVLHFLAYGVLATALLYGFSGDPRLLWKGEFHPWQAVLSALAAIAYGFTDEWHQSFVPGRTPSWHDIGADCLGALAVAGIAIIWIRLRRKQQSA